MSCLKEINWEAVYAKQWSGEGITPQIKEGKQAEFLVEHSFPMELVEHIGVYSSSIYQQIVNAFSPQGSSPRIEVRRDWYY